MKTLILLYLAAVVLANLLVTQFGASVTILNAFVFIGPDISSRDFLHEAWHGKGLAWKMALLIASGSILSALLNWNASQIALASFAAFAASGFSDTLTYSVLGDKSRLVKMNGSNLVSAAVDSTIFPLIAFGWPLMWWIVLGQFAAKVAGGFIWAWLLNRLQANP